MNITKEHVAKIAALAKLKFSDSEKEALAHELGEILSYIEKLDEIDTTNVEPLSHPTTDSNVMREDRLDDSLSPEAAVANAPEKKGTYFVVPKVIK